MGHRSSPHPKRPDKPQTPTLPSPSSGGGMTGLGGLDVDDESCRVAQLERADAGRLGQTGAPTQDRLEVAKLLDFLHDGEVGRQIATAAVARRAACSLEDDTETRRPAHRDRQTARILDELRRG